MAVFICCADGATDSLQQTDFFFGGYAATVDTWERDFAPAWNERVLKGPPVLEHMHMSALMSSRWRRDNGISDRDANRRIEEPSFVIGSSGGLIPFICHLSQTTADFLCWHERHAKAETLDRDGHRRRNRMVHNREGFHNDVDETLLNDFTGSLKQTFPRIRRVVSDGAAVVCRVS